MSAPAVPFSLLLPTYHADDPDHLRRAFASAVDEQTLKPNEVVLVRDGVVPPLGQDEIRSWSRFHDPFNHPTVVYRRSMVQAVGGYRDLPLLEDYWLFARMIDAGARVANVAEPLVKYRVGAGA